MAHRISPREGNARLTLGLLCGVSIVAAASAIYLGLRHDQSSAIIALIFAVVGGVAAWFSYRRYTALRSLRWRAELAESNRQLDQMLEEQRGIATPPGKDAPTGTQEDNRIAKR